MKKLLIVLTVAVLLITAVATTTVAMAADEEAELVYKAAMIDSGGYGVINGSGEAMVWNNGQLKIKIVLTDLAGGPAQGTYYVFMDYGPPTNRQSICLGPITTKSNGKGIAFFELSETGFYSSTTPGFVVRVNNLPIPRPSPPSNPSIAVTGFFIPAAD